MFVSPAYSIHNFRNLRTSLGSLRWRLWLRLWVSTQSPLWVVVAQTSPRHLNIIIVWVLQKKEKRIFRLRLHFYALDIAQNMICMYQNAVFGARS